MVILSIHYREFFAVFDVSCNVERSLPLFKNQLTEHSIYHCAMIMMYIEYKSILNDPYALKKIKPYNQEPT